MSILSSDMDAAIFVIRYVVCTITGWLFKILVLWNNKNETTCLLPTKQPKHTIKIKTRYPQVEYQKVGLDSGHNKK